MSEVGRPSECLWWSLPPRIPLQYHTVWWLCSWLGMKAEHMDWLHTGAQVDTQVYACGVMHHCLLSVTWVDLQKLAWNTSFFSFCVHEIGIFLYWKWAKRPPLIWSLWVKIWNTFSFIPLELTNTTLHWKVSEIELVFSRWLEGVHMGMIWENESWAEWLPFHTRVLSLWCLASCRFSKKKISANHSCHRD